jgi:segregation and condensation protein B
MAGRATKSNPATPPPEVEADPSRESLGLDDFTEPDDQGLSLNELSQAYAALLAQGADPYPEGAESIADEDPASQIAAELTAQLEPPAPHQPTDPPFEVTPRGILEAILFVGHPAGEPLTTERMASLMRGVRPSELDDLIRELNAEYAAAGAPYSIESVGPGYRLALRSEFAALAAAFHGRIREARLSQSAIDILAIVSYHQPLAAAEIDKLRGKPSGAILSQLVRRDLLALQRSTTKGEPPKYRTTSRFLELFGLENLSELPRSHDL